MLEKKTFFVAPDLSDDDIIFSKKTNQAHPIVEKDNISLSGRTDSFFISTELDNGLNGICIDKKKGQTHSVDSIENVPCELAEDLRKKLSTKLLSNVSSVPVKKVIIDDFKERVIVRFIALNKNISCDIDVPLDITANDLIVGLNNAYKLGIDISDIRQCYMSCENPIALLKGKRLLGEYGVRDGSLIIYYR